MKRISAILSSSLAILATAATLGTATASAASSSAPMTFSYRGSYANASSFSSVGCIDQGMNISASSSAGHNMVIGSVTSSKPLRGTVILVDIWRYDTCNDVWSSSFGFLDGASLTKLNNLQGARIVGSVATTSYTNASDVATVGPTVAIDLTLEPTSKVTTYSYSSRSNDRTSGYNDHGTGKFRTALVAGTLSVAGTAVDVNTLQGLLGTDVYGSVMFGNPFVADTPPA